LSYHGHYPEYGYYSDSPRLQRLCRWRKRFIDISLLAVPAMIDNSYSQVVDADFKQRASFELWLDGEVTSSSRFEGQGKRVNMKDRANQREYWSFGPVSFDRTGEIRVKITHYVGTQEKDSKMVGPLSVS
jgi:hypothetical protein